MATHFHPSHSRAAAALRRRSGASPFFIFPQQALPWRSRHVLGNQSGAMSISRIKAASSSESGDSYLDMWKKARERERSSMEFQILAENSAEAAENAGEESAEELEKRNREFEKLLEVPAEERDKVQRMQVIDRAAAAIAAARALLKDTAPPQPDIASGGAEMDDLDEGRENGSTLEAQFSSSTIGTPGPSFWAWAPPLQDDDNDDSFMSGQLKPATQASPFAAQSSPVLEQERSQESLSIPFETAMLQSQNLVPPLQSLVEVEKREVTRSTEEKTHQVEELKLGVEFSTHAAEAAGALSEMNEASTQGVNPDGTRWWKETGIEQRPDGVVCKWTLVRGVSADKGVEWENKYWEAADELAYKELGSEKSGRDAAGNVWREYWRESMMEIDGSVYLEKTAEKWGNNAQGTEWQEKWWERYGAGQAEKWAHKWCSIDPHTPLEAGHAHIWHERWGEKYDGLGGSTKYTDKWAERYEGDGWAKWGDKWDEHFDANSQGVKQGESWWEGKYGERWNRTWGEGHNGSGWVHKYGKSSCGEHWDTHVQQDTWYERFPHYGFYHCFENSTQLRDVKKPSEWPENS
ncbi:protein LIKE EARLY STARVATION, chloroplastic [Salvia miltiorrhiza]|uniref:protein LIKE EARLY STARVATION, chloroplastic n=1 Tax=Salvia miltiorrhiza TaxID=226208 RepID=UPI0025AB766D|nr:protein LIKE EARLY STARVATION, chloroplastic [Salvia miltiorrhiza]